MNTTPSYGFYGKLPCTGDFLRRDLSQGFVAAWDQWMQAVLVTSEETLGEAWLNTYLTAPIWRFAFGPGICGPRAVAGMWMPSVDRVGRKFPFCIAVESDLPTWAAYLTIQPVIARIEDAALGMLTEEATLPDLESKLATLPAPGILNCGAQMGNPANAILVAAVTDQSRVLLAPQPPVTTAYFDLDHHDWQKTSHDPI